MQIKKENEQEVVRKINPTETFEKDLNNVAPDFQVRFTLIFSSFNICKGHVTRGIFLATCFATMTTEKIASCRWGVTRSQYFFATCNAPGGNCLQLFLRQLEISREQKTGSDCVIFTKLPCRFRWTCHTQDISTFLATRNATFCCRCRLQNWGVTREIFLATCLATKSCKKNCLV